MVNLYFIVYHIYYTMLKINCVYYYYIVCFFLFCKTIVGAYLHEQLASLGGSVGCAVRLETRKSWVQPRRGWQHSFVEIDHEIFSTVILSLLLIQEGQLSVSGERMCTILINRLED